VDQRNFSREAQQVLNEAGDIAHRAGKRLDSSHLILAIFTVPCEAQSILLEKRLDVDRILDCLPVPTTEANETISVIYSAADHISANLGSRQVTSVHLLMAVSRITSSNAAGILEEAGLPMFALRTHAMAHLTDPRLRRAATKRLISTSSNLTENDIPVVFVDAGHQTSSNPCGMDGTLTKPAGARRTAAVHMDDDHEPVEFATVEKTSDDEEDRQRRSPAPVDDPDHYRFALDPDQFPTLVSLGRNLTLEAEQDLLDPLIGRDRDLDAVVDILCKRRSNNPLLLGDPGVGKTALVEGLATMIVSPGASIHGLHEKVIIAICVSDLLAGTSMRGSFSARLKAIKDEVLSADRRVILFIDEIHTLIGAGVGDGPLDAANDLKGSLARGEFPCIGATTFGEYQRHILPDPALERRFECLTLQEPSQEEADNILRGVAPIYEEFHGVRFSDESLRSAVRLTDRFIADRSLPSKAIDLLDRAGARVSRDNNEIVHRKDVVSVLSGLVDLPSEFLSVSPSEGLRGMERHLSTNIVGHAECSSAIARVLAQNWARFGCRRPLGSFIFVGSDSVGKKSTAIEIADFLFGTRQAFLEVDLSDYVEAHSLSQLVGSPPGYVGHEEGGLLSDLLTRRPFVVVVWRNAEMAHPSVLGLLTQILTEGTATDRHGRRMDFRNTIQILSGSFGFDPDIDSDRRVGFGVQDTSRQKHPASGSAAAACRRHLPGDLVTAIDEVLPFRKLDPNNIAKLTERILAKVTAEIEAEHDISLLVVPELSSSLCSMCSLDHVKASDVEASVIEIVSRPLTDFLFSNGIEAGATIRAIPSNGDNHRITATFEVLND